MMEGVGDSVILMWIKKK